MRRSRDDAEVQVSVAPLQTRVADSSMQLVAIPPHKRDPTWKHVQLFKNEKKSQLTCVYCGKVFNGGGIYRVKEHLAGQKGNGVTCHKVPPDVRHLMQELLEKSAEKGRVKKKHAKDFTSINPSSNDVARHYDKVEIDPNNPLIPSCDILDPNSTVNVHHGKVTIDMFDPSPIVMLTNEEGTGSSIAETDKDGRLPINPVASTTTHMIPGGHCVLASNKSDREVHMAIGQFFYDVGLPPNAVNSAFFQPMLDAISSRGIGIMAPSYHDLRGWILRNALEKVKNDLGYFRKTWGRSGCSILVEEWSTDDGVMMVNIFVYCLEGTIFLKSVDVTDKVSSTDALFQLLKELVEEVGVRNVLQVITGRDERFTAAGKSLSCAYPSLFSIPCAAEAVDLMLEDFGKLEWINATLEHCKSLTKFIYNSSVILNMLRRHTSGADLVEPGVSPSVTNFKTLRRIVELKQKLQALSTSQEWVESLYSKNEQGQALVDCTTNPSFWSSCSKIVHLVNPLLRVLQILDCEKMPAMGYIYAGIYRAKESIRKQLKERDDYLIYWNIIDHRWELLRQHPLHAAGFYLNPKLFYSIQGDVPGDIISGMLDCIEKLVPDTKVQDKIIKELNLYQDAAGDFGRNIAIRARDNLLPSEWWSTYGAGCPNLARLAVRILGQTCCLVQNKQDYSKVFLSTDNSLEHGRLNDLVFTRYNLRLRQKLEKEESDVLDSWSFNSSKCIKDWVGNKQLCLEDDGCSDWKAVWPPAGHAILMEHSIGDAKELGSGFDDNEIFIGSKDDAGNIQISW